MKTFEQLSDEIYTAFNPKLHYILLLDRVSDGSSSSSFRVEFKTDLKLRDGRDLLQTGETFVSFADALWEAFNKIRGQMKAFKNEPQIGKDEDLLLGDLINRSDKIIW